MGLERLASATAGKRVHNLAPQAFRTKRTNLFLLVLALALVLASICVRHESFVENNNNTRKEKNRSQTASPFIVGDTSDRVEAAVDPRERINEDHPSEDAIRRVLREEQVVLARSNGVEADFTAVDEIAKFYELVYAFVAAFHRHDIVIFLGWGSHLGARRHHAVIPFGEHDVDFQIMSLDAERVFSIITETLQSKSSWADMGVTESYFGYQLGLHPRKDPYDMRYYIDFWLFDDKFEGDHVRCTGHNKNATKNGCQKWYDHVFAHAAPVFERDDYFPPAYQVFGSHKLPIPAKSSELETFEFRGDTEHWNTTCGSHRWVGRFINKPKALRKCTPFYKKYPFVFKVGDSLEELRQGGAVLHRTSLTE